MAHYNFVCTWNDNGHSPPLISKGKNHRLSKLGLLGSAPDFFAYNFFFCTSWSHLWLPFHVSWIFLLSTQFQKSFEKSKLRNSGLNIGVFVSMKRCYETKMTKMGFFYHTSRMLPILYCPRLVFFFSSHVVFHIMS